jgi:hypothetical protein
VYTKRVIVFLFLLLPSIRTEAAARPGDAGADAGVHLLPAGFLPSTLETYSSSEAFTADAVAELSTARTPGQTLESTGPSLLYADPEGSSESKGDVSYLPVLFSFLMPGVGEIYLGYRWRGAALVALEVAAWTGYFHYHKEGLDSREAYENFADTYWDIQRWVDHHPDIYDLQGQTIEDLEEIGRSKSGSGDWPGYIPYVSKEEDKQHFYENIGKYDWYISGWQDFDPEVQPWMRDTPLRDQYRSMRKESNDQLDTANAFIYLSLGTRVFSIIETFLLARSAGRSSESKDVSSNYLRVKTKPKGFSGGEIALEYHFK